MVGPERYRCNATSFSFSEMKTIRQKRVAVIGCGGLGGFVCQGLARFGVGGLTLVDGDTFEESNLNRQLFATEQTLGQNKAQACKNGLFTINSHLSLHAVCEMLTEDNSSSLLRGIHLAVDCLDTPGARLTLAAACTKAKIPLVHGAIGGFYGHVANVFPGDGLLQLIYPPSLREQKGVESKLGNPVFTPQVIAGIQVCEALKLLAERTDVLQGEMLYIDLLDYSLQRIPFLPGRKNP